MCRPPGVPFLRGDRLHWDDEVIATCGIRQMPGLHHDRWECRVAKARRCATRVWARERSSGLVVHCPSSAALTLKDANGRARVRTPGGDLVYGHGHPAHQGVRAARPREKLCHRPGHTGFSDRGELKRTAHHRRRASRGQVLPAFERSKDLRGVDRRWTRECHSGRCPARRGASNSEQGTRA